MLHVDFFQHLDEGGTYTNILCVNVLPLLNLGSVWSACINARFRLLNARINIVSFHTRSPALNGETGVFRY